MYCCFRSAVVGALMREPLSLAAMMDSSAQAMGSTSVTSLGSTPESSTISMQTSAIVDHADIGFSMADSLENVSDIVK